MFEFIQKQMYKMKNSKEGMTAIEMVIGVLIFIILLSFMMDILVLFWKFSVIAQTTTQVARITGIQGGANNSRPTDWPGADDYITIGELNGIVQNKLNTANIGASRWRGTIGDRGSIGSHGVSETTELDYKKEFTVSISMDYQWDYMSNIIPFMELSRTITARRPAMSEWKYNYGQWNGE